MHTLAARLSLPLLLALALPAAHAGVEETLLLQEPALSREHVAFVYAQDLWLVPRSGGVARRLTSHPGAESSPRFSPDGTWIAFSAAYEGNTDVYLLPVTGGMPRRLTWHPGHDRVQGWHPDGKRILFSSSRQGGEPVDRLYLVSVEGGEPAPVNVTRVGHATYDADGKRIAYTPVRDAFRSWKRYRGGRTTPIWLQDLASGEVQVVPHTNASDTFPAWLDGKLYFASDREGQMNLYRWAPGQAQPEQLTRFTDHGVRNLGTGGGAVVFEQAGALHLLEPGKEPVRLTIQVPHDGLAALPRWQAVKGHVRAGAIAPNGKRAAFEARGEILDLPREHGDARNLTGTPGAHERSPAWSPDGRRIAWLSDETGEYRLVVRDRLGDGSPRSYDLGKGGFYFEPRWSPDGERILFHDKTNRLAYLTLASGEVTEVARLAGSLSWVPPQAVWSPDGKWIAYRVRNAETTYDRLALYELASRRHVALTDGFSSAASPAFSRDGKYLFFAASVEGGPRRFGLDMTPGLRRPERTSLYVAVLSRATPHPLAPKSDEAVEPPAERTREPGKKNPPAAPPPLPAVTIEPDGLDQRILALPLPAAAYVQLACSKERLLVVRSEADGSHELARFDFEGRKLESVRKKVEWIEVAADGKHVLMRGPDGWGVATDEGKDWKALDPGAARVRVEPEKEWPQILREVWRLQRDFFYDREMHGVDWPAMWTRWSAFLPHVRHRADLNVVIAELIGELACGHQYVRGGEMPAGSEAAPVGLLGADTVPEGGRHKLVRIYRGQNWNPGLVAPLTGPGLDAREGDYLIAIAGRDLAGTDNLHQRLEGLAGKQVELLLSSHPDGRAPRRVRVVPVANDWALRQKAWVESNRRKVQELSGGRLGYLHLPNTADAGVAAFDRDFYSQLDRPGLVIDIRYNGGGKLADYVLSVLQRQVMCYWMNREEWLARSPFGTHAGPKVMITNEYAGSGGDALPWLFRRLGLGPLVGTRTWGGLVGISGYPPLVDGGSVTAASFGVMDTRGNWAVENVGVPPDHEVIQWPREVLAGRDPQLEKAVALALAELERRPPAQRPTYRPPAKR